MTTELTNISISLLVFTSVEIINAFAFFAFPSENLGNLKADATSNNADTLQLSNLFSFSGSQSITKKTCLHLEPQCFQEKQISYLLQSRAKWDKTSKITSSVTQSKNARLRNINYSDKRWQFPSTSPEMRGLLKSFQTTAHTQTLWSRFAIQNQQFLLAQQWLFYLHAQTLRRFATCNTNPAIPTPVTAIILLGACPYT